MAAALYSRTAIFFHWLVAGLMVLQFPLGWLMQQVAKEPAGPRADAFNLHKSIGLVILALVIARLAWRLSHPVSPHEGPAWQRRLARVAHVMLYVLMITMATSGYLGSVYGGRPILFFGLGLPSWGAPNHELKELMDVVHLWASWALLATFAMHIAGAVSHSREGHGLAGRMNPHTRLGSIAP